jgi:hypothetical protein
MLLHPGYDSDMSKPQRATAFEHKTKLWSHRLVVFKGLLRMNVTISHEEAKHKQGSHGSGFHGWLSEFASRWR